MLVVRTALAVTAMDVAIWLLADDRPLAAFLVALAALPFAFGVGLHRGQAKAPRTTSGHSG